MRKFILLIGCLLVLAFFIQNSKAQENLILNGDFELFTIDPSRPTAEDPSNWRLSHLHDRDWKIRKNSGSMDAYAQKWYDGNFIASNQFTLEAGKDYRFSFDLRQTQGATGGGDIKVILSTTQDITGEVAILYESSDVPLDTWSTATPILDYTGDYYIVFTMTIPNPPYDETTNPYSGQNLKLSIDNVSISEILPGKTTITPTAGWTTPASISSHVNSEVEAETMFKFTVTDDATSALPSMFDEILIPAGSGKLGYSDFYKNMGGAILMDADDPTKSVNATRTEAGFLFSGLSTSAGELGHVADGTSKTYELKVWFPELLILGERNTATEKAIDFVAKSSNFNWIEGSDVFEPTQLVEAGAILITATADRLYIPYYKEVFANTGFKMEVWTTNDALVTDKAATPTSDISVTLEQVGGSGVLSSTTGLTQNFIIDEGKCIWTDLSYSLANDPFQIKATATVYGNQVTYTSDMITADIEKDYVVGWNFTDDDNIADMASSANTAVTIESVGPLGNTDQYNKAGNDIEVAGAVGFRDWSATTEQYIEFTFSTLGFENLALSSTQRGATANSPKDFQIQYKIGSAGVYTDVPGGTLELDFFHWGASRVKGLALPAECNNEAEVSIRYLQTTENTIHPDLAVSAGMIHADDIYVVGINTTPTDLENATVETINIYPNPVKNTLFLSNNNATAYTIYSANGGVVASGLLNRNSLDAGNLSKGIYFIRITLNDGSIITKPFIK
ncbi:T9SS type A sorting domain-containing protein [Carboxylicivirga marina]|uniref:T9SS type A sorting domain-containing protein n=1 Tax=Carboxylicivirga marina TaxID=2800988 RepID=A0ABS1HQS2_9BACT|nr:T9SS type A sorting domain-containing protein [Carboxylicivirga marina]MBK3519941.1 T9SS type A sorting domain-containing protein [Carboxylicivirga marina]